MARRIRSAERPATRRTSTARTSARATATPSTIPTSTIPVSAQQPRRSSRTHTSRCLRSSVGSEDSQQLNQPSSIPTSARPASSIHTPAQQPSVTRHTHISEHLRSTVGLEGSQQESQRTNYQPGQVQQQPHTRPTKHFQPSSSESKNPQNNKSLRRPAKHGPPSDQPRSTKRLRLSPSPLPNTSPPSQPGVRLLIHTCAPSNPSQDALYRKQAEAVLRGFEAATHMSLSSSSFGLPTYEDGESIPDRQVDPRDAWMSTAGEGLGTYDEDLEAIFRRYDKPRVVEAIEPGKKPQKEVKVKEDEVVIESPPDVWPQVEDDGQQYAQRREKLPSPSSTQYSSLGFLLPDVGSWETPGGSIPESQAQDANTVEVPSSPILPPNREDGNIDGEEMGIHIPSSQPGEPGESVKGIAEASFPEILTGDLTSPEFCTSESVKRKRGMQEGRKKGRKKDFGEQAGLSCPAYQVLREGALDTSAAQRQRSSPHIPSTLSPLQGNKQKRGGGRRGSVSSQLQAQAQAVHRSPITQSLREAAPTPRSVAASTRSQTAKKPLATPSVRGSRIEKAKGNNAKGKSKSQITLNALALQLSQPKSASMPNPGRYATRSNSRRKQIKVLPPPPPLASPPPIQKPQTPPSPYPSPPPRQNREFFYAPPAPAPLNLSPSQLPPPHSHSLPSTASSIPLTNLPPFSPPFRLPNPPPLSTLVPHPHAILPPDLCPGEVNTNPLQITSYLARLEEKPHTWVPYFKPVVRRRELRVWERGCWVIDLSSTEDGSSGGAGGKLRWEGRKEKIQFWDKLKGNVLGGRLGMVGVFLGSEDVGGGEEEGDTVKVYCWGKVAELVWAFLFVISDRRTKVGLRWVDARGEVVIQC